MSVLHTINHSKIRRREQGLTLMIVMIALVSLSLAALGLVRSIDTGNLVMGNLAFRQGATASTDTGVEAAITWLQNNSSGTALYDSRCASGCTASDATTAYYATSLDSLDVTGHSTIAGPAVNWDGTGCSYKSNATQCLTASTATTTNGYATNYVITRMCKTVGDPNGTSNNCAKSVSTSSSASPIRGALSYGSDKRFGATPGPYYRIITRSRGPRNTVSYTETFVHF